MTCISFLIKHGSQNWIDQQREGHKEDRRLKKALENTTELKDAVNELLIFMEDDPKIIKVFGTSKAFEAEVELPFTTESEIDDFVSQYQEKNLEVLRIDLIYDLSSCRRHPGCVE